MPTSTTLRKPTFYQRVHDLMLGPARDPMNPETRHTMALIAFFAWVGLGADGLSSSAYGPEVSYLALGPHSHLGVYLAIATMLTVFLISFSYNQVIDLFPNGGGGYKVATQLVGSKAGLVSGAALIVDYVLTIAISVASGVDNFFSLEFIPPGLREWRVPVELVIVGLLVMLNLRGMKEAIKVLLPIFLGFVFFYVILIFYGLFAHADRLPGLFPATWKETTEFASEKGWIFVVSSLMLAYAQGGGTYTGLEAVSNNVNTLKEPRKRTGKWTMFYMACSLAAAAGGLLLLYVLWDVKPVEGQTLNAVLFRDMMSGWQIGGVNLQGWLLPIVMAFTAGLLFVAANTGFLGGPAVLSNMAVDQWVPNQFSSLSTRLVTKHGVMLMGVGALGILLWTQGQVKLLAVIYSINVFVTFSISLYGLCIYWWRHRHDEKRWFPRMLLSATGFVVCSAILAVLVVQEFPHGGWVAVIITGAVVAVCMLIKRHYTATRAQLKKIDELFAAVPSEPCEAPPLDPDAPTAIFMVSRSRGAGMHTMLWVQRLFPGNFKNFVFLSVGAVDTAAYGGEGALEKLQKETHEALEYYVNFCHQHGIAAKSYEAYGTDRVEELTNLVIKAKDEFANCVFFSSKLIFVNDNWFTRILHNQTPLAMQRILHLMGLQMVILPMKVE
jgi:amino acid transporter